MPARVYVPSAASWQCPGCDHLLTFPTEAVDPTLPVCLVCGNHELYKKKDFPHWLGMTILVTACVASVFTYGWYEKWLTWAILIGSAAFDGLLYLVGGDVVVCYRGLAHSRGLPRDSPHKPFELGIAERYRQERARLEQLKKGTVNPESGIRNQNPSR